MLVPPETAGPAAAGSPAVTAETADALPGTGRTSLAFCAFAARSRGEISGASGDAAIIHPASPAREPASETEMMKVLGAMANKSKVAQQRVRLVSEEVPELLADDIPQLFAPDAKQSLLFVREIDIVRESIMRLQ